MDSAVVKYLINNILSVLATEASLLWGVRDAIDDIKDESISMQSFLVDADKKGIHAMKERKLGWQMWVGSDGLGNDDDGDEDGGFGVWVDLEVGVGEGVEAVGLSGFVVEVVAVAVVALPIWFWWAMGCGSRFWVGGIVGRALEGNNSSQEKYSSLILKFLHLSSI
nr:hypothetical protein CFP56_47004 [Quercus suber]